MRLLRVGPAGHERPAVLGPTGAVLGLSGVTPDIGPDFLADDGIGRVCEKLGAA